MRTTVRIESLQMFDVVNEFLGGTQSEFSPLDLIKRAGQIFFDSEGQDGASMCFLKRFLADYAAKAIADPKNFLAIAVRGVAREEKQGQAVEIMEYVFAYLDMFLDKLPDHVLWAVAKVRTIPPDAGFLDRVAEKMADIKTESGRAAV